MRYVSIFGPAIIVLLVIVLPIILDIVLPEYFTTVRPSDVS